MSSYMVDAKILGRCCDMVVNYCVINRFGGSNEIRRGWYRYFIDPGMGEYAYITADSFQKSGLPESKMHRHLWDALGGMNRDAVNARYREDESKIPGYTGEHEFFYRTPAMAAARVKAAHELLYQCSEGRVPETDLFKLFEASVLAECERIVKAMPAYEAA